MTTEVTAPAGEERNADIPEKITREDLRPGTIPAGGTEIVLQRHGDYERRVGHKRTGSLTPEAVEDERRAGVAYFDDLLNNLSEEERATIDILVVASDTRYRGGGRRSLETATIVEDAARAVLAQYNLNPAEHIINLRRPVRGEDGPRTKSMLREPRMFEETPDFVTFLEEKYGSGRDFWIAFEEDTEQEKRREFGAEGPDDIADRMEYALKIFSLYARWYHQANPGRRLVIWAATHYDTISPLVKRDVLGLDKTHYLGVDNGAGIVIDIDNEGAAQTTVSGRRYPVPITS